MMSGFPADLLPAIGLEKVQLPQELRVQMEFVYAVVVLLFSIIAYHCFIWSFLSLFFPFQDTTVPDAIEEIDVVALVEPGTGSDESMAEAEPDADADAEPDGADRDDTGDGGCHTPFLPP